MLLGRGVALVVEVVEQGGGRVELDEARRARRRPAQPVGLGFAAGGDAGLHGQRVLAQAFALGPLGEQLPGLIAAELRSPVSAVISHFPPVASIWFAFLRVSSGYDAEIFGLTLSFYLTIMVHSPESSTYRGAKKHPGDPALALRTNQWLPL